MGPTLNFTGVGSGPAFVVGNSTTTSFIVTNAGKVGIGNTSPIAQFSVMPGITTTSLVGSNSSGLSNPQNVYVQGRYAYVVSTGNNSLVVYDISNPASPAPIAGSYTSLNSPQSVYVQGRYAYVASQGDNSLYVLDISNPSSPSLVGSLSGLTGIRNVYVQGRFAYVLTSTSFVVIDVSNPSSPVARGSLAVSGGQSIYVQGRYAVVGLSGSGVNMIDVSNPASPAAAGSNGSGASNSAGVYIQGSYAYVASSNGFTVYYIWNLGSQVTVSTGLSGARGVYVQGRYAYVASNTNNQLAVFDVSSSIVASTDQQHRDRRRQRCIFHLRPGPLCVCHRQ